jgi:hypothetical protein
MGKRSGELRVRVTIQQHMQVRLQRELARIEGPPRRKVYPNGARSMPKQGKRTGHREN